MWLGNTVESGLLIHLNPLVLRVFTPIFMMLDPETVE
jgi:hypothetical protein